jgi:hypothetical protein
MFAFCTIVFFQRQITFLKSKNKEENKNWNFLLTVASFVLNPNIIEIICANLPTVRDTILKDDSITIRI